MNLTIENVVVAVGLLLNFLAIIGYSNRHERRMTRIETIVTILANRSGINTIRHTDHIMDLEDIK